MEKYRPFRLGTTSFIYPDNIIPNVKKLSKNFKEIKEIELLIFECIPEQVLPVKYEIKEIESIGKDFDLSYNIHLPTDISLTDTLPEHRKKAVDTIKKIIDLCAPLTPTTYTLHLDFNTHEVETGKKGLEKWRDIVIKSLDSLVSSIDNPAKISIETLNYPFEFLNNIIDDFGLSVCVDVGHMIKYHHDMVSVFKKYNNKIPIIHLHGVDFSVHPPKCHTSLDKTPRALMEPAMNILKEFKGTVSLEVFNHENLTASLAFLNKNYIH